LELRTVVLDLRVERLCGRIGGTIDKVADNLLLLFVNGDRDSVEGIVMNPTLALVA